ncbi:ABC transporter ATP-binding protein [uncultured Oscillibacter sp.]|uniref:ABC transporter ATP-binding protein n=1 Tax=uncultured Oscillibacter sp. TaxID=876091 RepID=UPI002804A7F6|nr:ABC transporter ATP-binding protein [uncultured Oscillibacter sp.]
MKERTWLGILLSFAAPCRGKMAASVVLAILSVAGGFVPYLGVYQIIRLFLERQANWEGILFWCGVCLAGYAVKVAGYALSTMLVHVSAYTILEGLRLQAADRLMGAPLGEVDSRPIGAMKSTIVDRIEDIEPPLAHMIPELSSNILLPLVVVVAMFAIDWRMGMALLVTIPVALIPMAFGMRTYNKNYAAYMAANAHVNSVIVEYVEGIQVVKAFSQGERSYQKFAQAASSFKAFTMDWYRCTWASMNLCLSILPTTLLGTLPMGIYLYQTGVLDPALVTLCLMMALGIVTPLMSATAFINSMKSMQFAVKDTRELLDLPQLSQSEQDAPLEGCSIQLKDVSFSYGGSDGKDVLHHLDLTIPQGKFTALVGPSGGGKSTIARLVARFWDVTGGSITLGGRDIRALPLKQLSREISFVTQDNFLFDCSLKENIRLGRPGASDEEVFAAAKAAQCDEFIGRLEHGWDTAAGDAGKQLSGGERQRIAIARAILKDAPIVILDEATAFTDPENEDKIQRSIMALSKGKTLLVIAHRLSTIQNANQIVVLEKGQIVDRGTQRELLSRCPLYQALWAAHVGAQTWAVTSGEKEGN